MLQLHRVGVVGAGNMGSGIAQKCAQAGLEVVLVDVSPAAVERGRETIARTLGRGVERGAIPAEALDGILGRVTATSRLADLAGCQLVVEAVFEDRQVKEDLFRALGPILGPEAVVGSNTSSFRVGSLALSYAHPAQFLGLHFFYHPAMNRLLEIIPAAKSGPGALELARAFSARLGKVEVVVADAPGFAVNRFFVPWLNEATRLWEEGVADIPTIEAAAKKTFRVPMGPFELMNATGIPISYHSTTSLAAELGPFYAPSRALTRQFEAGQPWDLAGEPDLARLPEVADRLQGVVFLVCGQILDENVCGIGEVETGAKVGLRWAKGPFEMMNRLGIHTACDLAEAVVEAHEELTLPASLAAQVEDSRLWHLPLVELRVEGPLAFLTFNRPEALNALNETVVEQLREAFLAAESRPGVKTIVLEGKGKAFVAGADIGFFLKQIKAGTPQRIVDFAARGQEVFNLLAHSKKWVVAKVEGLALGGGAELVLACHTVVATSGASLGFPETSIGIYPGLGGTQRSLAWLGLPLARYLVLTGRTLNAAEAHELGLFEYLVEPGQADSLIRELTGHHPKVKTLGQVPEPTGQWAAIAACLADAGRLAALLRGEAPADGPDPALAVKLAGILAQKAPLALAWANEIMEEGAQVGLERGLSLELARMEAMFRTADALEGLSSVTQRRKPQFKGA
ncbi:MAG: 3-hydroxyacyl-CoA dehydrogenase/enoyl-CoA hydratase family protein [Deltaproteobacteria bacterium]|nr:3-hydroxyacyl-CoA dehydrogenase/enoyl-CoA hydratase family protein [Deltaproteobacteria bacterium]